MKIKMYAVYWVDAASNGGWWKKEEWEEYEPPLIFSIGILMEDKKDYILLASGLHDGEIINPQWIPKGMIKSKKRLKL